MSESDSAPKPAAPKPGDVETLLRQRDELDRVIREQFQRRVAVIFTDIQGSTQYFERYGDLAGRAMVQRHNDLLFPLIAEAGGRVVKTIGDAIMAFFPNSASAVQAAIRMQRALAEKNENWLERERIFIRIGVHVGEALVDAADVYGDTVNTAARIEAQASGGEILISDAARAELGAGAPPVRARGAVKLKGKAAEVALFEVRWRERESAVTAASSGKGRWIAIGGAVVGAVAIAGVAMHALHGRGAGPSLASPVVATSPSAPGQQGSSSAPGVTIGASAPAPAAPSTSTGRTAPSPAQASTIQPGSARAAAAAEHPASAPLQTSTGQSGSARAPAAPDRSASAPTATGGEARSGPSANAASGARSSAIPQASPGAPPAPLSAQASTIQSGSARAPAAPDRSASAPTATGGEARSGPSANAPSGAPSSAIPQASPGAPPAPLSAQASPSHASADRLAPASPEAPRHHRSTRAHEKATRSPAPAVAASSPAATPTGTVRIHVFPFADVFVDGKRVGKGTMDVQVTVPAGDHRLRLVNPGFPEKTLTLHVKPGANEEQDLSLTR